MLSIRSYLEGWAIKERSMGTDEGEQQESKKREPGR